MTVSLSLSDLQGCLDRQMKLIYTGFDNGDLKDDPGRARIEVDDLLAAMRYPDTYDASRQTCSPLVAAHNSVWFRIREVRTLLRDVILLTDVLPRNVQRVSLTELCRVY